MLYSIGLLQPPKIAPYSAIGLARSPPALHQEIKTAAELPTIATDTRVRTAGLVLLRQSPGTANNTTFMTIEDEIGHINIIVWNNVAQKYPRPFLQSQLLEVEDKLQHHSGVMHLIADEIIDHSRWLGVLRVNARHFR